MRLRACSARSMAEPARGPVLGVDGGATKTDAVVMAVDGRILGSGRGGSSNWESVGLADAVNAIVVAVDGALAQAGHTRREVAAAVFALAGVDWPADHVRLAAALPPGPRRRALHHERRVCRPARGHLRARGLRLVGRHGRGRGRPQRGRRDGSHHGGGLRRAWWRR